MHILGANELAFEKMTGLVIELFTDFFADAFPLIGIVYDGLWQEFFAALDGKMLWQTRSLGFARFLGFGDGLFSRLRIVAFRLSQGICVIQEKVFLIEGGFLARFAVHAMQ